MKARARIVRNIVLVFLLINVLYAIVGFVIVPACIRTVSIHEITKAHTYAAKIGKVSFNPYSFEIAFHHILIDGTPRGLLFSGDTLSLNFDPLASLRSGMFVFKDFLLLDGRLRYVRRTVRSPLLEFLIAFDWSRLPQFSIARARILNSGVIYANTALPKVFSLRLDTLNIEVANFLMHGVGENAVSLSAVTGDDEHLSLRGTFFLEPYAASGEAVFENIKMTNYEPYIRALDDYSIADGRLSGRTKYDLDSSTKGAKFLLSELSFTVDSFDLFKKGETGSVLSFSAFDLDDAAIDLMGRDIVFDSALMTGGALALDQMLPAKTTNSGALRGMANWESVSLEKSSLQTDPFQASIGKSALVNGNILLSDDSFDPPAKFNITGLDISLGKFFSEDSEAAAFSVKAKMEDKSSFQILGETTPFNFAGHTQFRMLAQNVSLLPFSPYAAKHLGYGLRAGIFGLDTHFLLDDRALAMQNKLVLKHVEVVRKASTAATGGKQTSYPIPLALALLTDGKGEIELDVPVTGSLEDPHWNFGKTITEAVFRPFTNFFDWLNGDEADRLFQGFPFDSSQIAERGAEKLDAVIAYAQESSGTLVDIEGSVDELNDTGDLRLLADDRAAAVKNYLVVKGNVAEERIFILNAASGDIRATGSRAYVYLNTPATE